MSISSSTRTIPVLAIVLALAVFVETLLFRIFARGGVYFINEDTPSVIKNGYTGLIFGGNVLFNFAAPLALLILGLIAMRAWLKRPDPVYVALTGATGVVVIIGILMMIGLSGSLLSTPYFVASSFVLVGAFILVIRRRVGLPVTAFVLLTGMSYLAVYSFKGFGSSAVAETGIRSASVFELGEWLSAVAFLALLPLLRDRLDRRSIVIASFVSLMVLGMAFGRPDSVPLIAIWAFGLSLSLPYIVYVAALWVVVAFFISSIGRGNTLLTIGVLLVMLGHRTIPLTYFNDLVLVGLLLASMYTKPVAHRATAPGDATPARERRRGSLARVSVLATITPPSI